MSNCIAIIPARSGSKRIPKKNIKLFYNKPLISHVIKKAKVSNCFDKIVISSDCDKTLKISKKAGADILIKRPLKLSKDNVITREVVNHAIRYLEKLNFNFEYVCLIYPHGVLLDVKNLKLGLKKIRKLKHNFVFTITEYQYPIQRSLKMVKKKIKMNFPKYQESNSNNLDKSYHDAGQFYFGRKENFLKNKPLFSSKSFPIILKKSKAWDIDDLEDWEIAKRLFK